MGNDAVTSFVRRHHHAVLIAHRADGSLHTSPVVCGVDAEGRIQISVTQTRVKTRILRRNPAATLTVLSDDFFAPWIQVDGTAEIVDLPEAMDLLKDTYRQVGGEHEDWNDFEAAQLRDQRCIIRITVERAIGPGLGG